MKLLAFVGLFSVAAMTFAYAAETTEECQVDVARRAARERVDAAAGAQTAAPTAVVVQRVAAEAVARAEPARGRRGGKRIPDAELIGPRGAL
jgi:hypothetical protein